MRSTITRVTTLLALAGALAAPAAAAEYTHKEYFEHYEGTKTCLKCHEDEARAFFQSQHYQWQGETPAIANAGGRRLGKINTINDFCTNPAANWIDIVRNSRGEIISKGCSACHAGLGLRPATEPDRAQLENIDCLICHASGYRRDLYPDDQGGFVWKPILWRNQEGMDSVAKRIGPPQRTMCLRCHSASGGGPNWKRGDLEYVLRKPERDYDIHMSPDGADLQCIDCHAGEDHRVIGRGADLSGTDTPGARLECTKCHEQPIHAAPVLDAHTSRVYCTTCHLPAFARTEPTDMDRDWSRPVYDEEADKYKATIDLQQNVRPVYHWFNGKTNTQLMAEPLQRVATGEVGMMIPLGSRDDPTARIYAFKLHRGRLPVLDKKNWLIPIVVEGFFADGNIDKAVREAADHNYGVKDAKYTWTDTVRYMGVFHSIPPASEALGCLDCHAPGGRMDWKALGYEGDPLEALISKRPAER